MQEPLFSIPGVFPQTQQTLSEMSCAENPFAMFEDMGVTLNTAFVRSRIPTSERNLAAELDAISKAPAYQAVMGAAKQLSLTQNVSELEAAEQIICTFRKMDELWQAYLIQEGMAEVTS